MRDGFEGFPERGPYDGAPATPRRRPILHSRRCSTLLPAAIHVGAAPERIPDALRQQLKPSACSSSQCVRPTRVRCPTPRSAASPSHSLPPSLARACSAPSRLVGPNGGAQEFVRVTRDERDETKHHETALFGVRYRLAD